MSDATRAPSGRREELLESAYRYALRCGLADLSLRPLATAIGSSPRVLLFLFGSKDGLIRELLARARREELALLDQVRSDPEGGDPTTVVRAIWRWLVAPAHRPLLTLWLEAYARSLVDPRGPWAGFARQTVDDWLTVLAGSPDHEDTADARAERTLTLAVLRGVLLDLLATGDVDRTTAAVERHLNLVDAVVPGPAGSGPR
ncbi:TetR/AcrR family transcriptional regulator [Micromonospora avicenniae]|uniref:Transcriptional regulator, TetR family n=1 Tax=Micromonospora avicenniae TaxID=1198245 RepID=A0A1N6VFL7_9ACTN|nr:TetR/AcrR family transcriptional regulator [Micromonospora avicenniae]SIQ76446.1 transcriptional regulator, TetR family [Micromonospora avicenniae]